MQALVLKNIVVIARSVSDEAISYMYYVYILSNKWNTTLYVGVTNNLIKRIFEHKQKLVKGFTQKYNIEKLVYYEQVESTEEAIKEKNNSKLAQEVKSCNLF